MAKARFEGYDPVIMTLFILIAGVSGLLVGSVFFEEAVTRFRNANDG